MSKISIRGESVAAVETSIATVVPPLLKRVAPTMSRDKIIVVTLSGRGDKDCASVARYRGENIDE